MIIKRVTIQNYLCYYDNNIFDFANGLNIVLGENGEGKTKFFEAIEWLFKGDGRGLCDLVSAKMLAEVMVNEEFPVRVSMEIKKFDETYTITKSFIVKKTSKRECSTSNFMIHGVVENNNGERTPTDGVTLLDRIFPPEIRRYSMFKGESELNIFENADALVSLINSFSQAKYFQKYDEKGKMLRDAAEKNVNDAVNKKTKSEVEYRRITATINDLETRKHQLSVLINTSEEQISKLEDAIGNAEKYVANADELETVRRRIQNIENEIRRVSSLINENYTTLLFDEQWLLINFENIQREFSEKINAIEKEKRKFQSEFDKQIGIKEGRKQIKAELLNDAIPLPVGVPSKAIMEEMLAEGICKVCNRPAEKGTPAYDFMKKRLEQYLSWQNQDEEKSVSKVLYIKNYLDNLVNLSLNLENNTPTLRETPNKIKDFFEFNKERRSELADLNEKLEKELASREKIIGRSSVGEEKLSDILKNYSSWQKEQKNQKIILNDYQKKLDQIEEELFKAKAQKDKIDVESVNPFLIKTRDILRDIETIFVETKEMKFKEFLIELQEESNKILTRINVDSFTGSIIFSETRIGEKRKINVDLRDSSNLGFIPNQSLLTSMHISILFAISIIAEKYREESFPMIFDAPTSSFGETKTGQFLNLIFETKNQKILLIKDFLITDDNNQLQIKSDLEKIRRDKTIWVRLVRPFDKQDITTINAEVINF